jgi:acyl-CoA thioester hydrolase
VSRVTAATAASVSIQQTVRRGHDVLTEAEVVAALVAANGRPRRQPRAWTDIYQRLARDPDHA